MNAHRFLGSILVRMGRLPGRAAPHGLRAGAAAKASGGAVGPVTVMDPEATTRSILAWIMALLGYPDQARANRKAAVARAQELQHAPSLGNALSVVERADWILREDGACAGRAKCSPRSPPSSRVFPATRRSPTSAAARSVRMPARSRRALR